MKEVNAQIIPVLNAKNAAEAYEIGASKAQNPWRIFVHQDVYFPTGSGMAIERHLGRLSKEQTIHYPIGFAGLTTASDGTKEKSGLLIDRKNLFKFNTTTQASSIDEFAVAFHKDARITIDPEMGWHLWGTDLCIQSKDRFNKYQVQIIDAPLFHNSTNDFILPEDFFKSLSKIFKKYPEINLIETLCGKFNINELINS